MKKLSVNQAATINGGSAALVLMVLEIVGAGLPYAWGLGQWIGSKIVGR